jgi:hypothetical protein
MSQNSCIFYGLLVHVIWGHKSRGARISQGHASFMLLFRHYSVTYWNKFRTDFLKNKSSFSTKSNVKKS